LFAPFTKFKVTKVILNNTQNTIYMKELPTNSFLARIYDMNLLEKNEELKNKLDRELNYQFKYEKLLKTKKMSSSKELAAIYRNLGVIYGNNGNHTWAMDYFNKSLALYMQFGDQFQLSTLKNNIGLLYCRMGKHVEALNEY
jgi:tetratricopeptide (TPR) repeat protein